ncbi:MAG: polyprenol monophosphomannose synthase [Bacteroidetes bacterium]|nr:polyprenol monophosphomannose synthase [Bacteroidota bacterium]MCL1969524.1 polyprenol monophosphomannose synthase [Bacteroidota bacterium]MCL1969656.1 polyprenol monophosphomannose synthase [Bacteroidota bacterium]
MEIQSDKKVIIIPTYNEKENIENIIHKTFSVTDADILVIDDGSPDGTANIVKKLMKEYLNKLFIEERTGKLGLGTAYIHGFKWALARDYDYVFEMDADFSHNPEDIERLYAAVLEQNADVAVGSRYCQGVNVLNWPMSRLLISYYGSMYVRVILGIPVKDTTAGFMCYSSKVLKSIDFSKIKHIGYGFQIEMKFNAYKLGYKIIEVPIIFKDRTLGTSKMSAGIFKEAIFGVIGLKVRSFFRKWR